MLCHKQSVETRFSFSGDTFNMWGLLEFRTVVGELRRKNPCSKPFTQQVSHDCHKRLVAMFSKETPSYILSPQFIARDKCLTEIVLAALPVYKPEDVVLSPASLQITCAELFQTFVSLYFSVCTQQQKLATGHHQYDEGPPRNDGLGSLQGIHSSVLHKQQQLHQDCGGPGSGCRRPRAQCFAPFYRYAEGNAHVFKTLFSMYNHFFLLVRLVILYFV